MKPAGDLIDSTTNGVENGDAEITVGVWNMFRFPSHLNLFDLFLQLPIIHKCIFPFWNELRFQLPGELHHAIAPTGKRPPEQVDENWRMWWRRRKKTKRRRRRVGRHGSDIEDYINRVKIFNLNSKIKIKKRENGKRILIVSAPFSSCRICLNPKKEKKMLFLFPH